MTDRGPVKSAEVVELVREAALQRGFYWVGIGHAYAGDELCGRPIGRSIALGWLGGPHVYAEVDPATLRIPLLEQRG